MTKIRHVRELYRFIAKPNPRNSTYLELSNQFSVVNYLSNLGCLLYGLQNKVTGLSALPDFRLTLPSLQREQKAHFQFQVA